MKLGTCVLTAVATLFAGGARAEAPIPVSPGGQERGVVATSRCPTFHWAAAHDTETVSLVVYELGGKASAAEGAPTIAVTLPGSSRGWAPSLDQCLEPGGRYAWTVGAGAEWSEPRLFEVAAAPSFAEVEHALRVLRSYVGDLDGLPSTSLDAKAPSKAATEPAADGLLVSPIEGARVAPVPLSAESVGAGPSPRSVIPPPDYALSIDADFGLGGHVFSNGYPLLHTEGGSSHQNTALGINALDGIVPGTAQGFSGAYNTVVGYAALSNLTTGNNNTAVGTRALYASDDGRENTAVGREALAANHGGFGHVAVGAYALSLEDYGAVSTAVGTRSQRHADGGQGNTSLGAYTLYRNVNGHANTAVGRAAIFGQTGAYSSFNTAVGVSSMRNNYSGSRNTAVGTYALLEDATGDGNIAIGYRAGDNLGDVAEVTGTSTYSDNIFIGNEGEPQDESFIRIGTPGTHSDTFIAGDVAIGTTAAPSTKLEVEEFVIGFSSELDSHVALVENSAPDTLSNNVLALRVTFTDPTTATNFITFFDSGGPVGTIEGDGAGGVTLKSGSGDFAEYLLRLDPAEQLQPGDVVGVFGGRVSKRTDGADRVLVVTSRPIILGNDPGEESAALHEKVALLGQVPVRVQGPVEAGDLLIASSLEDGTAVAVAADELRSKQAPYVIGRALEAGRGTVTALVGLSDVATAGALGAAWREVRLYRLLLGATFLVAILLAADRWRRGSASRRP